MKISTLQKMACWVSVVSLFVMAARADIVTAIGDGYINDANTWDLNIAPTVGDTNTWVTADNTLSLTNGVDTFFGQTLVIQPGGQFAPGKPTVTFTVNNVVLDGGTIYMGNNIGMTIDLSGKQLTLLDGTLKAGGLNNGRDVRFRNGSLAGSGTIDITGTDSTGSDVEFQSTINTTNFTGTFSVHDFGLLNLSAITTNNASFAVNLSGSGKYLNDANVAVARLTINGIGLPKGVYAYTDFSTTNQTFLVNNTGIITVMLDPDPSGLPPAAPSNLVATALSGSQINVTWTDNSTNEGGFELRWGIGTSSNQTEVMIPLPANTTNYLHNGLVAGTSYYFRVKATRASPGDSAFTPAASTATLTDANAGVFTQDIRISSSADDAEEMQGGTPTVQYTTLMTNFTLMTWINPTASRTGTGGTSGQRYAIYPTDGTLFGMGTSHVGVGISVGTNGIGVYENTAGTLTDKIEYAGTITNWTHVTVTYSNNIPRLYLNGTLVGTGTASAGKTAHPGGWGSSAYGWFKGFLDELRIYKRTLTAAEIIQIIKVES